MSVRIGGDDGLVEKALADLEASFLASGEQWRDASREGFSHDHLDPLRQHARDAVRTIRELEAIMREAVRQCS